MGSEMCIRDSTGDHGGDLDRRRVALVGRLGEDRLAAGRCGRGGCLLYTSDAADERSSVDLGGRRIIKKKNTQKCTHK